MPFKKVVCHVSYFVVLLYITLIVIGSCGLAEPPTSLALFNDISFDTFVIEAEVLPDELVVLIDTGTSTTLFQFSVTPLFCFA